MNISESEEREPKPLAQLWEGAAKSMELVEALKGLDAVSQRAIYLRFWESLTIEEIASNLRMEWSEVDNLLNAAFKILRSKITKRVLEKPKAGDAA